MSSEYGILIMKPGTTDTLDPRNWAMNTKYPMLKVASKGTGVLDGSPALEVVNHNLGYNPLYFLYIEDMSNPGNYYIVTGNIFEPYVQNNPGDPNNIYLNAEFASTQNYFYYIFYDETL